MEEALLNDLNLRFNEKVNRIKERGIEYLIYIDKSEYSADIVINCAGLYAQEIMQMIEDMCLFIRTPKRCTIKK